MFRSSLLAATALVLCVATAAAGQKTSGPGDRIAPPFAKPGMPRHIMHGFPVTVMTGEPTTAPIQDGVVPKKYANAIFDNINWHDKNAEWISWYGFAISEQKSCYSHSSQSRYCVSQTGTNALPFYGTGKKARKIGVAIESQTGSATEFNVGIYSATASGLPGKELAGGSTTASSSTLCCTQLRWVNVDIMLKARQEYFLAVSCAAGQESCEGAWDMEDTNFKTAQDYWHETGRETYNFGTGTHTYSSSSPWHLSTYYVDQGAAIIK